jgi:uncharacterized protein (TIGR02246 family)
VVLGGCEICEHGLAVFFYQTRPKGGIYMERTHDILVDQTEEQQAVLKTMDKWIEAVTTTDPETVAKLYAKDAVFWGTVSPFLRTTPQGIKDYFKNFMGLEHLKAIYYKPMVRVYGDIAVNSGYYTFFHEKDGKTMSIAARYTFVYRKDSDGEWYIIDHHSSAAP